jgi:hypothetical protein
MSMDQSQNRSLFKDDSTRKLPDINMNMAFQNYAHPIDDYSKTTIICDKKKFALSMVIYYKDIDESSLSTSRKMLRQNKDYLSTDISSKIMLKTSLKPVMSRHNNMFSNINSSNKTAHPYPLSATIESPQKAESYYSILNGIINENTAVTLDDPLENVIMQIDKAFKVNNKLNKETDEH